MATDHSGHDAISLANLFSVCVECFGLIHNGTPFDRLQQLELTKLGIQQGRLLAWGDVVGICETGDARNALLDVPEYRDKIEAALQAIIDRPAHTDRTTQFEKFGLKPPKRFAAGYEPALDFNRLEAFREKLFFLRERQHDGNPRRGKSATIVHWAIVDTGKFSAFVNLIRESIDTLVEMMDVRKRVDVAMRHDIRALGWHPVFERGRASRDMAKLKMVKEVCKDEYPEYAAAADVALEQLNREWYDNYESVMKRKSANTSEIPGAANKLLAREKKHEAQGRRASWLDAFRPKMWRKQSKDGPTSPTSADAEPSRSKSMDEGTKEEGELTHPRSKSIAAIPMTSAEQAQEDEAEGTDDLDPLTQIPTSTSATHTADLGPVTSMISRNDQFLRQHRASVA
ncbi:MAG: hypothetical protein INR71_15895 [Terriglobus roseus]|nr:hypothetical protein [Terriglobus roseus]